MQISYARLAELLNCFGADDDLIQTFSNPDDGTESVIYQQSSAWNTLPFIKYVFHARNNLDAIVDPLFIDYSEVDFDNLDENFTGNLNLLEHYYKLCGVVPCNKIYAKGTAHDDIIRRINNIYQDYMQVSDFEYRFEVTLGELGETEITVDSLFEIICNKATAICNELQSRGKTKSNGKPLVCEDFKCVYITEFIPAEVAFELRAKLQTELGYDLKYHCKELSQIIEDRAREQRLEETKAIAERCYGLYFEDSLLRDYKDFANDYTKYDEVYDIVCNWLQKQDTQGRCRYIVGEETCQIPCIEVLLAWVTLTTGTVFLFKAELERKYTAMMDLILKGDILPADLKFKILTKQPLIRDRMLLGVSTLRYGHENIETLVALKKVSRPVKAFRGVPLDIVLSEIKCTHDAYEPVNINNRVHQGFYIGRPKFNDTKVVVQDESLNATSVPYDTIDTVVRNFELRRQEVYDNLGDATDAIKAFYSPANYDKLLSQYLYSFEMIFTHYMGYDKFYTLNDIFIFDMKTEHGVIKYACTLVFEPEFTVQVINFCGDTPVVDNEEITVSNLYSPMFVADFQSTVEDNGYTYPEVNPDIQAAFMEALRVVKPVSSEEYLQLETTSTEEATADIFDYLYPIVSTQSDTTLSSMIEVDGTLKDDLRLFFKELIYSERERVPNSNIRTRFLESNSTELSVITDNSANINLLKEKIVRGLCNPVALYKRTQILPKLFNSEFISYKGLRFLHPTESPVDWTGNLRDIENLSPAMCKKRR